MALSLNKPKLDNLAADIWKSVEPDTLDQFTIRRSSRGYPQEGYERHDQQNPC